jgi:hypothetical protein
MLAILGEVKRTAHGALRFKLGQLRAHLDADELTFWRAGGPAILLRLTIVWPTVTGLMPASPTDTDTDTPAPLWRPTHYARPRAFTLTIA